MTRDETHAARKIRALQRAVRWMTAVLVGTLLLTLTGVTLVDVIGRYAFAQPLNGASEITQLLVMAIVFAGLPAICLDDDHITVDLFTSALKGRAAEIQVFGARLFVSGVLGLVAWQLWAHGERLGGYGQTTLYLQAPLEPIAKAAAAIAGVSALMTLAMAATWIPKRDSEGL